MTMGTALPCPECRGTLTLKPSRFGMFYGCSGYPKCRVSVGAHPDGSPLGTPATAEMKAARIRAHEAFDRLWKGKPKGARGRTYRFLQDALGLSEAECHIGMFDVAMCDKVVAVCSGAAARARLGGPRID